MLPENLPTDQNVGTNFSYCRDWSRVVDSVIGKVRIFPIAIGPYWKIFQLAVIAKQIVYRNLLKFSKPSHRSLKVPIILIYPLNLMKAGKLLYCQGYFPPSRMKERERVSRKNPSKVFGAFRLNKRCASRWSAGFVISYRSRCYLKRLTLSSLPYLFRLVHFNLVNDSSPPWKFPLI